ncbi:MAG: DUF2946 domain-containing protein [Ramlibacter sp.]
MHTTTHHRSVFCWSWIACLAILFNAFAPLVSHAMDAKAMAGPAVMLEMEVCTALGMEMRPQPGAPATSADRDGAGQHKATKHCDYCVVHAATHGLPPPPMTAVAAPAAGRDAWPPLYYQSSRTLFPWALAQPRAPPALS